MSIHPIGEMFPNVAAGADQGDIGTLHLKGGKHFVLVVEAADDVEDIDFTDETCIAVPLEIHANDTPNVVFLYDPDDELTTHDPPAAVRSSDGKVFKSQLASTAFDAVDSIEDDLPEDASIGDRFLVSAAPSGDFASYANYLCRVTSAGPEFVAPTLGRRVFVIEDDEDYQYRNDGAWHSGSSQAAGAVGAAQMQFPWGMVVEEETDTPPGPSPAPAAGTKWIVAANATGDWDDHDTEIAEADGEGGFNFYAPYEYAVVTDKSLGKRRRYTSAGGWEAETGAIVAHKSAFKADSGDVTLGSANAYTYSASTAPTTAHRQAIDSGINVTHQAPNGAELIFRYSADVIYATGGSGVGAGDLVVALYRYTGSSPETDAVDWRRIPFPLELITVTGSNYSFHIDVEFRVIADDADEHIYNVALTRRTSGAGNNTTPTTLTRRSLRMMEVG